MTPIQLNMLWVMYMRLLVYFNLLIGLSSPAVLGSEGSKNFVQLGCKVSDDLGTARFKHAADICLFLPDGSLISFTEKEKAIQKTNQDNKVIWKKATENIRSLLLSFDKKSLLVLGSAVKKNVYCNAKTDVVERISVSTGKTLASLSVDEVVDMLVLGRGSVPVLVPAHPNNSESNENFNCAFPAFAFISEISAGASKHASSPFLGSVVLYTDSNLQANYILSPDLKKLVWSTAPSKLGEVVVQNTIYKDHIYVASTFADNAKQVRIKKINFKNKKTIWFKDFQLDSDFKPIYHSGFATKDQLVLQTSNEAGRQFVDYEFDDNGNLLQKKPRTVLAENFQSKLILDFLKNRREIK